jgi:hypothetical protein
LPNYRDEGSLRTSYDDIEDYAQIHITFSDGTVADIFSPELVMGGVDWKSFATIIVARCNLNPTHAVETFQCPVGAAARGEVCALCTVCSLSPCSVGGRVRVKRTMRVKSTTVLLDSIVPAWATKGSKTGTARRRAKKRHPAHTV